MERYWALGTSLLSVAPESHKVTVSETGGGACLAAELMLQSGPWIFASFVFARIFAPAFMATSVPWIPAALVAIGAGVLDWRYRRIPNWLTVSGFGVGIAINAILYRWAGVKDSLLGAALGLGLLLPFVLVRSLGAGDWKLAGALGACLGWRQMLSVLMGTILVAGVMALAVVVWKGRLKQTLLNIAHLLAALFTLRRPGAGMSIDDPQSTKIPFGVAMAMAVLLCGLGRALGYL